MAGSELASLEASVDGADPSRLAIDIRLHGQKSAAEAPDYAHALLWQSMRKEIGEEVRREIRDGFAKAAEAAAQERMKAAAPRSRSWLRGVLTFAVCAAIGSVATVLVSSSTRRAQRQYASSAFLPPSAAGLDSLAEAATPESQSAVVKSRGRQGGKEAPPSGPSVFGLNAQ